MLPWSSSLPLFLPTWPYLALTMLLKGVLRRATLVIFTTSVPTYLALPGPNYAT